MPEPTQRRLSTGNGNGTRRLSASDKLKTAGTTVIAARRMSNTTRRGSGTFNASGGLQRKGSIHIYTAPKKEGVQGTLEEVFLEYAEGGDEHSNLLEDGPHGVVPWHVMKRVVEPLDLEDTDVMNFEFAFRRLLPEGQPADFMSFRIVLKELADILNMTFDKLIGILIGKSSTFMLNEQVNRQIAQVYGVYCDSSGRLNSASFLRLLRHCRILDQCENVTQQLDTDVHLDIAQADRIFRHHVHALDQNSSGITYKQFINSLLSIADFMGCRPDNLAGNVKCFFVVLNRHFCVIAARIEECASRPVRYRVPENKLGKMLFSLNKDDA